MHFPDGEGRRLNLRGAAGVNNIVFNTKYSLRSGFTLIELVVVLVVMAVLTHLAVREISQVRAAQLRKVADKQLETLRECVWHVSQFGDPEGFLSDMGRLPRLVSQTNSQGTSVGTLSELWRRPASARPFALLSAANSSLYVHGANASSLASMGAGVLVPTGWRGPYLRMPFGKDRLFDPWGNAIESVDEAGFTRIVVSNGFASAVSHLGSDARPDDKFAPGSVAAGDMTLSLLPEGGATSRLVLRAEVTNGSTFAGEITWAWYGPADGLITGGVKRVSYPVAAEFSGLTPGLKIVKDSLSGVPRSVFVRPGDNLVQIRIAVP